MTHLKAGDQIEVHVPGNDDVPAETIGGIVKYVGRSVYYYCTDACGQCGPRTGDGCHRIGMFGSHLV